MTYTRDEIVFFAEQIRINGYVVLPDRLPEELISSLRVRFEALLTEKAAQEPTNRGVNRYQLYLPWETPFANPLLYENPGVLAVLEAAMEPDPVLRYFASDTPLPGSDYQPAHSDTRALFPELSLPLPCYGIVLNVPLVDCTEENGSLEFWPCTHLAAGTPHLAELTQALPSLRANLPAGSLLLRDLRMWHRGTPNRSSHSRPHLALVYTRPWYRFELAEPQLSRAQFDGLSSRARQLLRQVHLCDADHEGDWPSPAGGKMEGGMPPT